MLRAFLVRLGGFAATAFGAAAVIFVVLDILPGDPASIMLGTAAREDTLAALRLQLGLDRPAPERFLAWLGGLLTGDWGQSITYATPVGPLVAERLAVTLPLAGLALGLALLLALPAGTLAAYRPGGAGDRAIGIASRIGMAVPSFWLGILLIIAFATGSGWASAGVFPAGGFPGWSAGFAPALRALVLPAAALALPQAAVLTRIVRATVLDVARADFVRTARAKGRTRAGALLLHALPNAAVPIVTIVALQSSVLIAGAVLVETVFNLPGLGRLAYQALAQRDLVVIRTVVLVFALVVIGANAFADLAHGLLDPRLRRPR